MGKGRAEPDDDYEDDDYEDDDYEDDDYEDDDGNDDGGVVVLRGRAADSFLAKMFPDEQPSRRRRRPAGKPAAADDGQDQDDDARERAEYERLHAKFGQQPAGGDDESETTADPGVQPDPPSAARGHRYFDRRSRRG